MKLLRGWMLIMILLSFGRVAHSQTTNTNYAFLHLASEIAPVVDLYLEGEVVFYGIEEAILSPERVLTEPGTYHFQVFSENANPASDTPLGEGTFDFEGGQTIYLVAYADGSGALKLDVIVRDFSPVPANLSRLQIVNLGANLPAVSLNTQNGDQLATGVVFEEPLNLVIPGGNYQVDFVANQENFGAVSLNAIAGNWNLLILHGVDKLRTFQLNGLLEIQSLFRFAHAGRLSPTLDVYFNDELVFSAVDYQGTTEYAMLHAGDYTVSLYEAGSQSNVLWSGPITLSTGFPLTGVALGESNFRMLTYVDDLQQIPLDTYRLRFIHAGLNMPLLTVTDAEGGVIVGGLEYPFASENLADTKPSQTLIFKETEGATYATLDNFTFQPNTIYTFLVVGDALLPNGIEIIPLVWSWKGDGSEAE